MIIKQSTRRYSLPRPVPKPPLSQAVPTAKIAMGDPINSFNDTEIMARTLEATGDYKILRRLVPRTSQPAIAGHRIGLIVDLETTGLDTSSDEVLEIAAVKFAYADDRIVSVIGTTRARPPRAEAARQRPAPASPTAIRVRNSMRRPSAGTSRGARR